MSNRLSFGLGCFTGIILSFIVLFVISVVYSGSTNATEEQYDYNTAETQPQTINTITVKGKKGPAEIYIGMPIKEIKEALGEADETDVMAIGGHERIDLDYYLDKNGYKRLHITVEDGKLKSSMDY